jgi:hypothetical protein
MHRTLIRLPAVVGLALPALALSLAAFVGPALASEPPAATAAALRTADEHDHSGTPAQGATVEPPPQPTPSATASTHDMEGMAGMEAMEGMDHGAVPGDHTAHSGEPAKDATGATARPRIAVLSTFAGVNGAVLISASVLRRRDRARHPRPQRRSTPPTTV